MIENNNLYINAPYIMGLIECLKIKAPTKSAYDMAEEIQNIILDEPWKEFTNG